MFTGILELKIGPGRIFGLDISHKEASVTVLHPDRQVEQYDISLNEEGLNIFLKQLRPDDRVVFENTGNCWYLYQKMKPLVREVAVADAAKVKLITHSNTKNDRNDSYNLALLMAMGFLPTVWMPDPQTKGDREILHHRMAILGRQTQIKNQIRSLLAQHGVSIEASDVKTKDAQLFLMKVAVNLPQATQQCVASSLRQLDSCEKELRVVDAQVVVRAQRWESLLAVLLTIPGVGIMMAFTLLAVIGDVDRFRRPSSLGHYTGDVPVHKASAGKSWSGGITKAGPKLLRWALTEAVQSLIRSDGYFRNMYRRIKKGKKDRHSLAVTACARELAETVWRMLTTGEPFDACVPKGNMQGVPSQAHVERRTQQQLRKQKREALRLENARAEVSLLPAPMYVIRENLDQVMQLASRADGTTPNPFPLQTSRPPVQPHPAKAA
jgi:transposase